MVQFVAVFIHSLQPLYFDCDYPKIVPKVIIFIVATFPRQTNRPTQFQIKFVVAGGGFIFYCNSHIVKIGELGKCVTKNLQ